MRKRLMAGNWTMHKTNDELEGFFKEFIAVAGRPSNDVEILFAVPYTLLERSVKIAAPLGIRISAHNVHVEASGAFTGEISVAMLKELRVSAALIGHSERRQYYNETDVSVCKKVKACLQGDITPIACIGETKEEREAGQTNAVVSRQLSAFIDDLS